MRKVSRRRFLQTLAVAGAGGIVAGPARAFQAAEKPEETKATKKTATIYVVEGKDIPKMVAAGIAAAGGWARFVKQGKKATVKVNAAWNSTPEQGGNTAPALAGEVVAACIKAGASEVVVPENPCSGEKAFEASGIGDAVKAAGGKMFLLSKPEQYRTVKLPQAKKLLEANIAIDVLDTGCLINMPVAKSHGGSVLTLSMKNWMGSVQDRGFWHRSDLHQCIADCSTFIKPNLIIMDATRIMLTDGPRGPGKLAYPGQIIFGTDPVACDAYATTLFDKQPFDIPSIKMAHDMGVGCGDLASIEIVRLKA